MSDMNFFSSYNRKSEKKEIEKSVAAINGVVILILAGIIAYGAFNIITIRRLDNDVLTLNAELEAARKNPKLSEINDREKEVSSLKAELSKLYALDNYIDDLDTVNEYVLEAVRANTPPELFLKSMVMTREGIKLEGISKDKESIAQFGHNLKEIEGLEKVFIPQVTDEKDHYSFYLDIDLKEEMSDGAEAGKQ